MPAVAAQSAPLQRGAIAGLADGPVGPARRRRTFTSAAHTGRRGPGRAWLADRPGAVGEVARPTSCAAVAGRLRQPIAVHAHVKAPVAAAAGDGPYLTAVPAAALPPKATPACLADRRAGAGAASDRLDDVAVRARGRRLPEAAAGAHAALRTARPDDPPATNAPPNRVTTGGAPLCNPCGSAASATVRLRSAAPVGTAASNAACLLYTSPSPRD